MSNQNSTKNKLTEDDKEIFRSILKETETYRKNREYLALRNCHESI